MNAREQSIPEFEVRSRRDFPKRRGGRGGPDGRQTPARRGGG